MKNFLNFKLSFIVVCLFLFLGTGIFYPLFSCKVSASEAETKLIESATTAFTLKNQDSLPFAPTASNPKPILTIINKIIKIILGIVGAVALALFIYGGMLWMTAHGNDTQAKKGQSVIYQTTLGLAVTLISYSLVVFVIRRLGG